MIELTKQNETFTLKETTDSYEIRGSITHEASGALNVYFNVNTLDGTYLGECRYSTYTDSNTMNFDVNCLSENREAVIAYTSSVIEEIVEHFKQVI